MINPKHGHYLCLVGTPTIKRTIAANKEIWDHNVIIYSSYKSQNVSYVWLHLNTKHEILFEGMAEYETQVWIVL